MKTHKMYAILGVEQAEPNTCLCEQCMADPNARVAAVNRATMKANLKAGFEDCSENVTLICSNCNYKPEHYSDLTISTILNSLENGQPYTLKEIKFNSDDNIVNEL